MTNFDLTTNELRVLSVVMQDASVVDVLKRLVPLSAGFGPYEEGIDPGFPKELGLSVERELNSIRDKLPKRNRSTTGKVWSS